jgi:hypothetical protein
MSIESSTKWMGASIRQKLSLVEAKLKPQSGDSLDSEKLWAQFNSWGRESESLKLDIYELAAVAKDETLLTRLKAVISFPPLSSAVLFKPIEAD